MTRGYLGAPSPSSAEIELNKMLKSIKQQLKTYLKRRKNIRKIQLTGADEKGELRE
jgi:hypothetical protein